MGHADLDFDSGLYRGATVLCVYSISQGAGGNRLLPVKPHRDFAILGRGYSYFWGALFFGAIALLIFSKIRRLDPLPYLDGIALGLLLAQAIGRWGNFINQELYGPPTTLPWGLRIDPEHRIPPYKRPDSISRNRFGFTLYFFTSRCGIL